MRADPGYEFISAMWISPLNVSETAEESVLESSTPLSIVYDIKKK